MNLGPGIKKIRCHGQVNKVEKIVNVGLNLKTQWTHFEFEKHLLVNSRFKNQSWEVMNLKKKFGIRVLLSVNDNS